MDFTKRSWAAEQLSHCEHLSKLIQIGKLILYVRFGPSNSPPSQKLISRKNDHFSHSSKFTLTKNISSNQRFSSFFRNDVTFTKFLPKKWVRVNFRDFSHSAFVIFFFCFNIFLREIETCTFYVNLLLL